MRTEYTIDTDIIVDLWDYVSGGSAPYTVKYDGAVIFTGRAYERPDGTCDIRLNDIISDYLGQVIPEDFEDGTYTAHLAEDFDVYSGTALVAEMTVYFYQAYYDDAATWLISDRVIPGMKVFTTDHEENEVIVDTVPYGLEPGETYTFQGADYTVACSGDYALYYVDAGGSWNSLLLEGRCEEQMDVQRHTVGRRYAFPPMTSRGEVNYLNEISKRWVLRTGEITDDGARAMRGLLGSTTVYLHNLQEDWILPVIITDTTTTAKDYRSEGKPVAYKINVRLAQDRIRK